MLVRSVVIRDIAEFEYIIIGKVLSVLTKSNKVIKPEQPNNDQLEEDGFWTYVGDDKHKAWLIYPHQRQTGKIGLHTI